MHAILSLSASHLTAIGALDCPNEALSHRHLAVQGLNSAMARVSTSTAPEQDAMLAACYALTFESSYAGIGITDFITMVRGCALVTGQIQDSASESSFDLEQDAHFKFMETRVSNLPIIQGPLVSAALLSFEQIEPLLSDPVDRKFYSLLLAVLVPLSSGDSLAAYISFTRVFTVFYETSHAEFLHFIDPDNHMAQILLLHFIAVQMIGVPLTRREWDQRAFNNPRLILGTIKWAQTIYRNLTLSERGYVDWPMRVVNAGLAHIQGLRSEYDAILVLAGPSMEGWLHASAK